jgi:hypothetical protein
MKQEELYTQLAAKTPEQPVKNNMQFPTGITDTGMEDYLAGANINLTKEQAQKILRYGKQLGLDLLTGSSLAEAFGFRPDIVGGKGYTPSYPELFTQTEQLAKEGKKAEALGKGIETGLVGVGAVGEGMMLAGALTGPLAPLIIGSGLALKGISKAGKLILESKTGIKVLANFTGTKDSPNIQNIEIPKDVSPDTDLANIINDPKIPTTLTDDVDTVDYIPDNLKNLNAEEVITTYITMPEKITRNQLITHPAISGKDNVNPNIVLDFDAAADKTNTYLKEKGFNEGSIIPVYRLIKYKVKEDPKGNIIGREDYQDTETLISGSLTPEANLKTLDYFTQRATDPSTKGKMGPKDRYEIVKYNVPQNKIKLAMGAYKNNITSSINKQLKNKNIIAKPIKGFKKINPAEDAKKLIDMQDEIIADVSGLKKIKLGNFSSYQDLKDKHIDKIIFNKIKNIDDYKKQIKEDFDKSRLVHSTRDEIFRMGRSENEILDNELEKAMPFLDKVTRFYNKAYVTNQPAETLQISQNPTFSRLEDAVNNLKQKKGSGEAFLNRLKGQAKQEELDWTGLTKFLKGKKEVTKEQIQSYMKQHSIPIEERVYSYNPRDPGWKNNPQYGEYTIDGDDRTNSKKYREFVFSIPQKWRERNLEYPLTNKEKVRLAELVKIGNKYTYNTPEGLTIEWQGLKDKLENYERKNKPLPFIPSHNYGDENLISRVRVKDRIDSDGNPTVHIEEIQSEHAADVITAKRQAEKDADSFYILGDSSEDKTLLPGITKQDVELLRKGYVPKGIKFRKEKTIEELKVTEKAIYKKSKELQKKHNVDIDALGDKMVALRDTERDIEGEILNYQQTASPANVDRINPILKEDLINIRKEIDNVKKVLDDFNEIYQNDKILNRLSNKSKRLQNRNRLNTLLRELPPEFPVIKDDWYKLPIDRIIRDAAERDIPSVTLTPGRVQYNRYSQSRGQYDLQLDKLEARDTLFENLDSFLKDIEDIEFPKRSKDDLDYSENRYIMKNNPNYLPMLSLANKEKLDKILSKYKLYKLSQPVLQRVLKSVQMKVEPEKIRKELDKITERKTASIMTKKVKEGIKKSINVALLIHKSAKVGRNYDTKYVGYLNDIAKKYNAKRDTTFVDNNTKDGISYRLEITPQMKKDYLKKGAARFKTGGYIKERL